MVNTLYTIAAMIGLAALLLAFVRMIIGPGAANRVVALDVMTIVSISLIVFLSAHFGRGIYLDIALVYSLIAFVGVVAMARYLERGL